jgi:hypothetical protein
LAERSRADPIEGVERVLACETDERHAADQPAMKFDVVAASDYADVELSRA